MRWDALFADLQAQLDAAQTAEFDAAVAEAARLESSRLELADRLRAHQGQQLSLVLPGNRRLAVRVGAVGSDWLSGTLTQHSVLVPLSALRAVDGMQRSAARAEASVTRRRLGIMEPIRRLSRDRSVVQVHGGEGLLAQGLIAGAGRDFLEIVEFTAGEPHRGSAASSAARRTLPLHSVCWLQSEEQGSEPG
ncbi:hypothetical protein [Nesterenkonia sp. Act20]|uniref:hypothetical protein n=1 Tax=Nesterenkonia sp. Act20 TaxID=1483432 RepID=UPI001C485EF3|nr:hypothetical protein [Nesterenkonia sp. Act20]